MTQTMINKRTMKTFGVFQSSPSFIEECDWCCHPVSEHGEEGCTHDRKIWFDGIAVDGPCGCTAVEAVVEVPLDKPTFVVNSKMLLAIACCAVAVLIGGWLIYKDLMNPVKW